jgi:hypothetical protein
LSDDSRFKSQLSSESAHASFTDWQQLLARDRQYRHISGFRK